MKCDQMHEVRSQKTYSYTLLPKKKLFYFPHCLGFQGACFEWAILSYNTLVSTSYAERVTQVFPNNLMI